MRVSMSTSVCPRHTVRRPLVGVPVADPGPQQPRVDREDRRMSSRSNRRGCLDPHRSWAPSATRALVERIQLVSVERAVEIVAGGRTSRPSTGGRCRTPPKLPSRSVTRKHGRRWCTSALQLSPWSACRRTRSAGRRHRTSRIVVQPSGRGQWCVHRQSLVVHQSNRPVGRDVEAVDEAAQQQLGVEQRLDVSSRSAGSSRRGSSSVEVAVEHLASGPHPLEEAGLVGVASAASNISPSVGSSSTNASQVGTSIARAASGVRLGGRQREEVLQHLVHDGPAHGVDRERLGQPVDGAEPEQQRAGHEVGRPARRDRPQHVGRRRPVAAMARSAGEASWSTVMGRP